MNFEKMVNNQHLKPVKSTDKSSPINFLLCIIIAPGMSSWKMEIISRGNLQ